MASAGFFQRVARLRNAACFRCYRILPCNVEDVLTVNKESIPAVRAPAKIGLPWRLSARFADKQGRPTLAIQDDHLIVYASTWGARNKDSRIKGSRMIARSRKGQHSLVLKMEALSLIRIEKIDMSWAGQAIMGDKQRLRFRRSSTEEWAAPQPMHQATMGWVSFTCSKLPAFICLFAAHIDGLPHGLCQGSQGNQGRTSHGPARACNW